MCWGDFMQQTFWMWSLSLCTQHVLQHMCKQRCKPCQFYSGSWCAQRMQHCPKQSKGVKNLKISVSEAIQAQQFACSTHKKIQENLWNILQQPGLWVTHHERWNKMTMCFVHTAGTTKMEGEAGFSQMSSNQTTQVLDIDKSTPGTHCLLFCTTEISVLPLKLFWAQHVVWNYKHPGPVL